jgi:hypothetical protein
LFEISKSDEKKLDVYEDFPILYKKALFLLLWQKSNDIHNGKKNTI